MKEKQHLRSIIDMMCAPRLAEHTSATCHSILLSRRTTNCAQVIRATRKIYIMYDKHATASGPCVSRNVSVFERAPPLPPARLSLYRLTNFRPRATRVFDLLPYARSRRVASFFASATVPLAGPISFRRPSVRTLTRAKFSERFDQLERVNKKHISYVAPSHVGALGLQMRVRQPVPTNGTA